MSVTEREISAATFTPVWVLAQDSAPVMTAETVEVCRRLEIERRRQADRELNPHLYEVSMTKTVGDVNPFATITHDAHSTPLASTTHRLGTTPERAPDEQLPNWFQRDGNDMPVEDDKYLTMFTEEAKPVEATTERTHAAWVDDNGLRGNFMRDWTGLCVHYGITEKDAQETLRHEILTALTGQPSLKGWQGENPGELLTRMETYIKQVVLKQPAEAAPVETSATIPDNGASSRGDAPGASAGHSESKALALTTSIDYETGEIIAFDPNRAITTTKAKSALVNRLVQDDVLVKGVDYGAVPGTDKNTLLKPGAEKLLTAFQLHDVFVDREIVRDWNTGFFFYEYECVLTDRETGKPIGTGIGSCNSMEKKYRFRWVTKDRVPKALKLEDLTSKGGKISEFDFAVEKAETTGKYGKPAEYWKQFRDALANGTAAVIKRKDSKGVERSAIEIDSTMYGIPNEDIFDLVNTISKMAQKRALVAAVLNATGASAVFTQDLEDFTDFGMIEAA